MKHALIARAASCFVPIAAVAVLSAGCATHTAPATLAPAATPTASAARPPAAAPPAATPTPAPAPAAGPATGAVAKPPAPAPLVGHVTRDAVEDYETWKTLRAQDYAPDAASVKTIADRAHDVDVLLILATWCPDSKREVPRFFKIYDQAGIRLEKVTMVAVDRTKKDAEGLTVKHDVQRVPTFVFFRNGTEIGRVTERATTTLEADIAAIVVK